MAYKKTNLHMKINKQIQFMESEKTDWLVVAKWLIDWLMNDWLIFSDHSFEDKKPQKSKPINL